MIKLLNKYYYNGSFEEIRNIYKKIKHQYLKLKQKTMAVKTNDEHVFIDL